MGSGLSALSPCFKPPSPHTGEPDSVFPPSDETLGHSFHYARSNRFATPTPSDRFASPSGSSRFSPPRPVETGFKSVSGASVGANASTPATVLQVEDDSDGVVVNFDGFESTASFRASRLHPLPRGGEGFFTSGPIGADRGALSGPLGANSGPGYGGRITFSAPIGGAVVIKKRRRGVSGIKKAIYRNVSEKNRPWVVPVLNFGNRKENSGSVVESDVQWALGKAGEDRVHVAVSEEQGWLFVGIYDGFSGPDAAEFLMANLYRAVYTELEGLFWEVEEPEETNVESTIVVDSEDRTSPSFEMYNGSDSDSSIGTKESILALEDQGNVGKGSSAEASISGTEKSKRVTFKAEESEIKQRRRLWEFLAEETAEEGLDLSGSDRFAFSVDDAISVGNAGSSGSRRRLLLSKLKQGLSKNWEKNLFPWKFGLEGKEKVESSTTALNRKRKEGPLDHELVFRALARALELTEQAYLDLTDKVLGTNQELALIGSCLLVALMRDEDVYVMNVGDSRAIVAQYEAQEVGSSVGFHALAESPGHMMKLVALQLSTDHNTSNEAEVLRIKNEHPDDSRCVVNGRVKGSLQVTRAFGVGSLKKPKFNDAMFWMFRTEYIGNAPYISCTPSLCHHQLGPRDQFLVLSSDGLYQYLTNQEVVSRIESFMEKFPDGDPAQHLIEELLSRAAKLYGMDFHELLDIPLGDRRKYHDDVTVIVISLEGRIWKSSGKYFTSFGDLLSRNFD